MSYADPAVLDLLTRIADALEESNAKSDRAHELNQQAFNLQKQLAASSAELEMMLKGARKQ